MHDPHTPTPGETGISESLGRVRSLVEARRAGQAPHATLPEDLEAAVAEVQRAAEADARQIVEYARAEARQVLEAARAELTTLVADILDLRRQRDQATAEPAGQAAVPAHPAQPLLAPPQATSPPPRAPFVAATPAPAMRARRLGHVPLVIGAVLVAGSVVTLSWMARLTSTPVADATHETEAAGVTEDVPASPAGIDGMATATSGAPPSGEATMGVVLVVDAVRDVWMRPELDGQRGNGFFMKGGSRRTYTAEHTVTLRVGDAGAVFVSLDGAEPVALGRDGAVVTRTFGTPPPGAPPVPATRAAAESPAVARPLAPPVPTGPATAQPPVESPATPVLGAQARAVPPRELAMPAAPALALPEPVPLPVPAPTVPPSARTPSSPAYPSSVTDTLLARSHRWYAAHASGNRAATLPLVAPRFDLHDERDESERPSAADAPLTRRLGGVEVHVLGDGAVLSASMVERGGSGREYISRLSEVWVRQEGEWRLLGVRIAPAEPRAGGGRVRR
jgi:hypothetical protein